MFYLELKRKIDRVPLVVWVSSILITILIAIPLVYLTIRTLGAGPETWELVFRFRTLEIAGRTLALVITVPLLSLGISLPLAWLTTRTDLPFKRTWSVLTALPLVIPSYIFAYVMIVALSPRGMLQQALASPFGIEQIPSIYGFSGALLSVTAVSYPYLLLPLQASLRGIDPSLEEASHSLGHGTFSTFKKVILPQLRPAIASGSLLIALYSLRDFGAVSLLRYETFTFAIYNQYLTPFGGRMIAAALSMILLFFALSLMFAESATRSKAKFYGSAKGSSRKADLVKLGRWRWPALAFCGTVVILFLVLPISVLGYWALRGISAGETVQVVWSSAVNSIQVSVMAAVIVVLAALPIAILTSRFSGRLSQVVEKFTYIGFALPGIVISLSIVFFAVGTFMYQTLGLLIFGYLILFLPLAVGSIRNSLLQINPSLEEASRSLGRTASQTMRSITIPLSRNGMISGAALVFLVTMKELQATLILSPRNFDTLATSIWHATSEAFFARAAVPALLLILLSSIPMMILLIFWHMRENYEKISSSL